MTQRLICPCAIVVDLGATLDVESARAVDTPARLLLGRRPS
jgi:hypothetical protein